jgi:hypothetical protein
MPYLGMLNAVAPLIPKTPFEIKKYKTYEEMVSYSKDKKYMIEKDKPGICFGFGIEKQAPGYDIKMFYSDTPFIEE